MILNASILRIDRSGGVSARGEAIVSAGADLSASGPPRCFMDSVSSSQRFTLGATIKDASQTAYVPKAALAAAGEAKPTTGCKMTVKLDDGDAEDFEVVNVNDRAKPSLSHFEVFLKKV